MSRDAAAALIGCALLLGCAQGEAQTWSYTPEERAGTDPAVDGRLVVLPFEDHRPSENSDWMRLYLVPLVPYGWADFETPEAPERHLTSGPWQFHSSDDLARGVADEIESARVFRETVAPPAPREDAGRSAALDLHDRRGRRDLSLYGVYTVRDDFVYEELLKTRMNEALPALRAAVANLP